MTELLLTISRLLSRSDLSRQEQNLFLGFCTETPTSRLTDLAALLKKEPDVIRPIFENFMAKHAAFRTNDRVRLEDIVQTEVALIERLAAREE